MGIAATETVPGLLGDRLEKSQGVPVDQQKQDQQYKRAQHNDSSRVARRPPMEYTPFSSRVRCYRWRLCRLLLLASGTNGSTMEEEDGICFPASSST